MSVYGVGDSGEQMMVYISVWGGDSRELRRVYVSI